MRRLPALLLLCLLPVAAVAQPTSGDLLRAVAANDAAETRAILADGVAPISVHFALDSPEAAAALLDGGADPNEMNGAGWTPLHAIAAGAGSAATIPVLVRAGADVDRAVRVQRETGITPLIVAAMAGTTPAARQLVQAGADASVRSSVGTAYEIARDEGHVDIARLVRP